MSGATDLVGSWWLSTDVTDGPALVVGIDGRLASIWWLLTPELNGDDNTVDDSVLVDNLLRAWNRLPQPPALKPVEATP